MTPVLAITLFTLALYFTLHNFRSQEALLAEIQNSEAERLEEISTLTHRIAREHIGLQAALGEAGEGLSEAALYDRSKVHLNALYEIEQELVEQRDRFLSPQGNGRLYDDLVQEFRLYRSQSVTSVLMTSVEIENAQRYMASANSAYETLTSIIAALSRDALVRASHAMEKVTREADRLARDLVLMLAAIAALSLFLAWLISSLLSHRILALIGAMTRLAKGEDSVEIRGLERKDEIGELARATQVFKETLLRLNDEVEEHRKTEDFLREERNFAAAINETAGALFAVFDREGRIVRFNRACEEASGYRFEEVVGETPLARLTAPAEAETAKRHFKRLLRHGREDAQETTWIAKSGEERLISWSYRTLPDARGEVGFVIACGVDVTDRRKAEERLRQAQKMEAVGQLTGGIAHDFNNLLAVIMGNMELLQEHLSGDRRGRQLVEPVLRAAGRGAELTQRLLAFARRQPLSPRPVDLDELISGMTSLLQRTLGEDIEILHRPTEGLWTCRLDRGQMEDALLNLAINARDAMPRGGRLLIETANVRSNGVDFLKDGEAHADEYVLVKVSDSGCGIPAAIQDQIFEPFFTTKEVGKGSGLGLSMVYGFVKQSGGHIALESEQEKGTTFKIYLPRARAAAEPQALPVQALPHATSDRLAQGRGAPAPAKSVLVVEDDADVRELAVTLLESLGYDVLQAGNGVTALDILRERKKVDLLFSDLVLPGGMSGRRLAEEALEISPELKVLYMSGYSEQALDGDLAAGEKGRLLRKPFRQRDLAQAVRSALDES